MNPNGALGTDYIKIKQCKEEMKGSFVGIVIKAGDLKSGTTNGKDWTMKNFTIEDDSDSVELTAWDSDEIEQLKLGNTYEVTGYWWKEYKNVVGIQQGKFGTLSLRDTAKTQTKIPEQNPVSSEKEIPPAPKGEGSVNGEPLPEPSAFLLEFTIQETLEMLQIEQVVRATMRKFVPETFILDGGKVGMFVKEIYRESKKEYAQVKFKKASAK